MSLTILKTDGTEEVFDGMKLEWSLRRAGASTHTAARIRETIETSTANRASTSEIYKRAFQMLRHDARPAAARYSLRMLSQY
jgi:transcriptional regulator NrdR family protein